MVQGYYSSGWATTGEPAAAATGASPMSSPAAKKEGSVASSAEKEEITTMSFLRWKEELQNRLIVEQEKRQSDERKQFKQEEDAKFWQRQQEMHQRITEDFGNSKGEIEAVKEANLARATEYKADLEVMKERIAYQRDEWRQFGNELTVKHGTEQVERTRARLAESLEAKAELGRLVKRETETNNKSIQTQRAEFQEHMHAHVEELKKDKIGKLDEALQYSFEQKKSMVDEVRQVEDKWKSLTLAEREAFLNHAHDNHEKNDIAKEQMRASRNELIKRNHAIAETEREKKQADATVITSKKSKEELAKKALRDGVYSSRYVSPDKTRAIRMATRSKSPQKMARDHGLIFAPDVTDTASPYRMPKREW